MAGTVSSQEFTVKLETGVQLETGRAGMAQWYSDKLMIKRSWVQVPAGAVGEFSSPESTFSADSYFGIHSIPMLPQ